MKDIAYEEFLRPSEEYSMAPFWFWNGDMQDGEICRQLDEMRLKGVYECIVHARKGLEVPYLSDEWFRKIRVAAGHAAKTGMRLWIYDENNWPSGYAGGRVIEDDPDFAAKCLSVEKIYPVMDKDVAVPEVEGKEIEAVVAVYHNEKFYDITDRVRGTVKPWRPESLYWEVFVFRMEKCGHRPMYSEQPYIDLLNPRAAASFIKHTHAEYRRRLPEYWGGVIKGFFTDEPGFYQNYVAQTKNLNTVVWTRDFRARFLAKFGYDIAPYLGALWEDMGVISERTRRDYYAAVSEFYCESYLRQSGEFLSRDGLLSIGHLHLEEGLNTLTQTEGDFFDCMAEFSFPGIDMISRDYPRMTEKLASSAMRIQGKERCFSESFGALGWELSLREIKHYTDLQFAQGINMLVPHAFFYSVDGVRSLECPPSLFFQNGYWKYFKNYADYVARLSYFCSRGRAEIDVAMYYPQYSARIRFIPLHNYDVKKIDDCIVALGDALLKNGFDYDFFTDKNAENAAYRALLLPETEYVPLKTAEALCRYALAGGKVVLVGRNSPKGAAEEAEGVAEAFKRAAASGNVLFADTAKNAALLLKKFVAPVNMRGGKEGVYAMRRRDGKGEYYFLVNTEDEPKSFVLTVCGAGAEEWSAETGEKRPADYVKKGGNVEIKVRLAPCGSAIYAVCGAPPAEKKPRGQSVLKGAWRSAATGKKTENLTFHAVGLHCFSGETTFVRKLYVAKKPARAVLDFGNVKEYISLSINGKDAGARLYPPYAFEVGDLLEQGCNELRVTVGGALQNEIERTDFDAGVFGKIKLIKYD